MTSFSNPSGVTLEASIGRRDERSVVAMVFVSFLLYSAIQAPVPGINEPHYLAKAKHFWNPDWCRGDFFLNSVNAHTVFYATAGWFTQWLSLEQTAWAGRAVALLLVAVGWTKMISRLLPGRFSPLWTAWTFLFIAAVGSSTRKPLIEGIEFYAFNLSGEWLVGGIEGKVFSYGLVFWSLGLLMERRWLPAAICGGLAISFHPVVGIWSLFAVAFAGVVSLFLPTKNNASSTGRRGLFSIAVVSAAALGLCALPGLLPAIGLLQSADAQTLRQAEFIQVYIRLAHHLDPMTFRIGDYVSYLFLILFWLSSRGQFKRQIGPERFFAPFVWGTILFALAGLLIGLRFAAPQEMPWAELRTKLLKFYPFRPCDLFVPIAVSVALVGLLRDWSQGLIRQRFGPSASRSDLFCGTLFGLLVLVALLLPSADRNPSRMEPKQLADWQAACRWISANTPADALFYTPRESRAFKWYAGRSEFVSYKDCPQDAAGIVEWNRRLDFIRDWERKLFAVGWTRDSLQRLHQSTGITHLVMHRYGPPGIEPVYGNETYVVYAIGDGINALPR